MDISIYRISYCSADATYDRVVAIICTNKNETLECHAFLTAKKKVAQAAALTISQAFTIAFENWQNAKNQAPVNNGSSTNGVKSRKCLSPSHSNGSGKLNNDRDNMHNDHNENKQPSLAGGRKKKDLDTLIDLSFEEVIPQQTPPVVPVTGDHWQLHEKNDQPFDVDLDDSFSRLAQSRSAKGHTAIDHTTSSNTVTTPNNPLCDQLQFEDAFKPVTPVALSENCINANNINMLLAAPASKSTSPVKSVSSAATCASELILPTNVKPGDFDVGELNSLFNNTNTNKQEHDKFFADTDDFFSLWSSVPVSIYLTGDKHKHQQHI